MTDNINHPSHYADGWSNGAEVIDITEHLDFCRGNAVKYLARAGKKDPAAELEDLKKAAWYVAREIERVEKAVEPVEVVEPHRLVDIDAPDVACDPIRTCVCGYRSSRRDNFASHCAKFNEVDSDAKQVDTVNVPSSSSAHKGRS